MALFMRGLPPKGRGAAGGAFRLGAPNYLLESADLDPSCREGAANNKIIKNGTTTIRSINSPLNINSGLFFNQRDLNEKTVADIIIANA